MAFGARRRVRALPDLRQRALALRAAPRGDRSGLPGDVRRPHPRPKDGAMNKHLRTLAALPLIALIGAGCGSSTSSETGAAGSAATVSNTTVTRNAGSVSHTGTAIGTRTAHRD